MSLTTRGAAGRSRTSYLHLTKVAFYPLNYSSVEPAGGFEPPFPAYRAGHLPEHDRRGSVGGARTRNHLLEGQAA